ncbi:MAG: hypothetical protein ACP5N3_06025 [Candidatus Nanoarchaeia archaeon]
MAGEELLMTGGAAGLLAMFAGFMIVLILILIGLYIYMGFAFSAIAKKANLPTPGLAWIPGVGPLIIAYQASKMHWWPWLLLIGLVLSWIPIIGMVIYILAAIAFAVYGIIWYWKMYEAINRPGWWAIMLIIPVAGLVFVGIAAWSKDGQAAPVTAAKPKA